MFDEKLLKKEIALWDEDDRNFFRTIAKFINNPFIPVADLCFDKFEHLGVFKSDKRFNDKGIAIIRILRD
jgi:hypothetical protein